MSHDQFTQFDELLEGARQIVEERKPNASSHKKAAFANTAAEVVTGVSGGYGGPSVRQHVAVHMLGGRGMSFDDAVEELLKDDGLIFGPLQQAHHDFWAEQSDICFDDDPSDVRFSTAIRHSTRRQADLNSARFRLEVKGTQPESVWHHCLLSHLPQQFFVNSVSYC